MSLNPSDELEFLKREFRKFISGLVSIPVKFPGTRLYKSLQEKANMVKMVHRIIQDRGTKYDSNKTREKDVLDVLLHETNSITGKFTIDLISDNMISRRRLCTNAYDTSCSIPYRLPTYTTTIT
ncbi:hypothetical protein KI387_010746, partial [Taxus chinensis]